MNDIKTEDILKEESENSKLLSCVRAALDAGEVPERLRESIAASAALAAAARKSRNALRMRVRNIISTAAAAVIVCTFSINMYSERQDAELQRRYDRLNSIVDLIGIDDPEDVADGYDEYYPTETEATLESLSDRIDYLQVY